MDSILSQQSNQTIQSNALYDIEKTTLLYCSLLYVYRVKVYNSSAGHKYMYVGIVTVTRRLPSTF